MGHVADRRAAGHPRDAHPRRDRGGVRRAVARGPAPHRPAAVAARRRAAVGLPRQAVLAQLADHDPPPPRPRGGRPGHRAARGPQQRLPPRARPAPPHPRRLARRARSAHPAPDLALLGAALGRRSPRPQRKTAMTEPPRLFRVPLEVGNLDQATQLYSQPLGIPGKRHPGARHYYDCGGVILAVLDVSRGALPPTPGPKSLYFAVPDLDAVHARAARLGILAPYQVHGQPAADVITRPWGERSFYVVDPWGNDLCFCEDGTLYT